MKTLTFVPHGVCARKIRVAVDDGDIIEHIEFEGGCDGNHKGLVALCKGQTIDAVAGRLEGIVCARRSTSCPDQLAKALRELE